MVHEKGIDLEHLATDTGNREESELDIYRVEGDDMADVHVSSERHILTMAEIDEHLKNSGVEWVRAGDVLDDLTKLVCVDGRNEEFAVSTPGGSLSEAILSMGVAEVLMNEEFSQEEVDAMFDAFLEKFGGIYMHTDLHAFGHMYHELKESSTIGAHISESLDHEEQAEAVALLLQNPPTEIQTELLEVLLNPDNFGCGHLKLMMKKPELYKVNTGLIRMFLSVFYRTLWSGDARVKLGILDHSHLEGAVLNVTVPGEVAADSMIPLIKPNDGKTMVFVNHPQVTLLLRKRLTDFFCEEADLLEHKDRHTAHKMELAETHLLTTLQELAFVHGLNVHGVEFDADQSGKFSLV